MKGLTIKQVLGAVDVAYRVITTFRQEASRSLGVELEAWRNQPREAGPIGEAEDRGFRLGINAACRAFNRDLSELDATELTVAVIGTAAQDKETEAQKGGE